MKRHGPISHDLLCHVMSCHVMSCHGMSWHVNNALAGICEWNQTCTDLSSTRISFCRLAHILARPRAPHPSPGGAPPPGLKKGSRATPGFFLEGGCPRCRFTSCASVKKVVGALACWCMAVGGPPFVVEFFYWWPVKKVAWFC